MQQNEVRKHEVMRLTPMQKITKDNIIGVSHGIRAYREGGFRLEREDIKDKAIYHNYGHGGGGVSLAPGCAKRIVDKFLMEFGSKVKEVAILGSGYMGLFQSLLLSELGYNVKVYAHQFPSEQILYKGKPILTSQLAGGLWMPFGCDMESNRPLFDAVARESYAFYKDIIEKKKYKGVCYKNSVLINYENPILKAVPKGLMQWKEVKVDFGNGQLHDATVYESMLIDGDIFLKELHDEAKNRGVVFIDKEFQTLDEILALEQKVIFNCTGGDSRKLFKDDNLIPIAGHLVFIKKIPGMEYFLSAPAPESYMKVSTYPHEKKIAIGLAYQKIGWITEPKQEIVEKIIKNMNDFVEKYTMTPKPKL